MGACGSAPATRAAPSKESPAVDPREAEREREWQLRAEKSAKAVAAMLAEVEREQSAEKSELGKKVAAGSQLEVLQNLWYGISVELRPEQVQPYLHAIMSVAGKERADSKKEQWLQDRTLLLGLTAEQRDALFTLDVHPSKVDPIIQALARSTNAATMRRLLFYDALTMATQSAFSLDEVLRAGRVATVLSLSDAEKEAIEDVVRDEDGLRKRKQALFAMAGHDSSNDSFINGGPVDVVTSFFSIFSRGPNDGHAPYDAQELASRPRRHALHRLTYGAHVPLVEQRNEQYAASLLAVASADGKVSAAESAWLKDRIKVLELDSSLFSRFFNAIETDGSLRRGSFIGSIDGIAEKAASDHGAQPGQGDAVAIAVLYDAVTMASQQGMTEVKRERSRRVAGRLGLSSELCAGVFAIVEQESELRARKSTLFRGDEVAC